MKTSGRPPKKNSEKRTSTRKPSERKTFEKPKFSKPADRKFSRRDDDTEPKKERYSDRKTFDDKGPSEKRTYKPRDTEKSYSDRPRTDEKRKHDDSKYGEKRTYKPRDTDKSYSDRPSTDDKRKHDDSKYGDKRPYKPRDTDKNYSDRPAPRYDDKRKRDDSKYGDKRPYKPRDTDKSYSDRPAPRYDDKRKRDDSKYGDKRPYKPRDTEKNYSDRPVERYTDKRKFDDSKYVDRRSDADKPYRKYDNDRNYTENDKSKRPRIVEQKTYQGRVRERHDVDILVKDNTYSKRPSFKTSSDGGIRLNKFIANAGVCSRREADTLIETGVITINGKIITQLGTKVMPNDEVRFGDQLLRGEQLQYLLLNKPKGYITTTDDPQERKTVMLIVEKACKERIYPVGRLDKNTTGLLLFTNDGELAKKLTHPKHRVEKVYHVELDKTLTPTDLKKIADGIELEDGLMEVDAVAYGETKKECGIELHSGKNRIVRRIFESLGYEVVKLDRVVYAGLTKKELPRGKYRFLSNEEVNILRRIN